MLDPKQTARVFAVSAGASVWGIVIGVLSLTGWFFGIEALKAPLSVITIKTNAAVALMTTGFALFFIRNRPGPPRDTTLSRILASVTLAIGTLTLCEHVLGIDLGIDQALFSESPGAASTVSPNRMGVPASLGFTSLGLSLLLLDNPARLARLLSQIFALFTCLVALLPTIGYVCQVRELYGLARSTAIAPHTAFSLLVLSVGVLCARPDYELVRVFCRRDSAGELARRLLWPALLLPVLLGAATAAAERQGWFSGAFAVSLLVMVLITALAALIWRTCLALGSLEDKRALAHAESLNLAKFPQENPNPVLRAAPDGTLMFCNQASRPLVQSWGIGVGDLLPEKIRSHLAHAAQAGTMLDFEESVGDRFILLQVVPILGKPYLNIYGRDFTDRRAAERELERVNAQLEERVKQRTRELEEMNDQLNAFCYSVAHDLKAPLRSQAAFATILESDFGAQLGETGRLYARRIFDAAERQSRLVGDLLAHMSVSRAELPLEPVELKTILGEVRKDLVLEVQDRKAILETGPLDHVVLANSPSLHLVMLNLVANAMKFVDPDRQPRVRVWSETVTSQPNGSPSSPFVRFWVEDNGIGIPAEYHHKLFGVFQRLHNARNYTGTGMGLAIVKKAAERMGGRVGVESVVGQGSRFWVELPAA